MRNQNLILTRRPQLTISKKPKPQLILQLKKAMESRPGKLKGYTPKTVA